MLARAAPLLTGIGLGLLALGPGVRPGFVLSYDMVFVPRAPVSAAAFGLVGGPPRAVPSDAVVALVSHVLPADVAQKLILILIFALACSGAATLVAGAGLSAVARPGRDAPALDGPQTSPAAKVPSAATPSTGTPLLARLAAGVLYAWNPYVAERLIIGQWALLLGYAGLPWVLAALCRGAERIRPIRLAAALVPAAIGGFTSMTLSAVVAVPAAVARGDRRTRIRRLGTVLALLGVGSLPWLIPSLVVPVHTDPRAVDVFAGRADTPFGRIGSMLLLGGVWNAETVPRGYGGLRSLAWVAIAAVALAGYVLITRRDRLCPGLGIAAAAGSVIAILGTTEATRSLLRALIQFWPGFAVLRDGQRFMAPLALAEAVGLGCVVGWVLRDLRAAAARAAAALSVMAAVAPILLLPGLAWGAAGRLTAVQYPADWLRARQIMDSDSRPGAALVLPWAAYRRYPWNNSQAVFDPWTVLLARRVILNDSLRVGTRVVPAEDPAARELNHVMTSAGPLTAALQAAGVRYVIVDAGPLLMAGARHTAVAARLPGAALVLASGDLVLYRLPPAAAVRPGKGGRS